MKNELNPHDSMIDRILRMSTKKIFHECIHLANEELTEIGQFEYVTMLNEMEKRIDDLEFNIKGQNLFIRNNIIKNKDEFTRD